MRGMTEIDLNNLVIEEDWVKLLQTGVFRVEFYKASNSARSIKIVSLDQKRFPEYQNVTGVSRPAASGVIKCWSFKDRWWRSFIIDHVVSVHQINDPDDYLYKLRLEQSIKGTTKAKKK